MHGRHGKPGSRGNVFHADINDPFQGNTVKLRVQSGPTLSATAAMSNPSRHQVHRPDPSFGMLASSPLALHSCVLSLCKLVSAALPLRSRHVTSVINPGAGQNSNRPKH